MNKNTRLIALLFGALTFAACSNASAQSQFSRGDANNDGSVSLGDVIGVLNYLFTSGVAPACLDAADVNDSGGLSLADPLAMLQFLFLSGAAPAEPFLHYDADPSADTLSCKATIVELTGDIDIDTTLENDTTYKLVSGVFVKSGATLTIEKGTTILGDTATQGLLVIEQGAKIHAVGTANQPIVFTSDQPAGSRLKGDWGGVIIIGNAEINEKGGIGLVEGLENTEYGGGKSPVSDDDSGEMSYVRIEFGGTEISDGNEVNGLSLFSVGSATQLDHIMVKRNLDDGIEFFGGAVNLKYGICAYEGDDYFDWSFGWIGNGQFWFAIDAGDDDPTKGCRGFEVDNNEFVFDSTPLTHGMVSNFTLVGARHVASTSTDSGVLYRRGAGSEVYNGIIMGYKAGVDIDDVDTTTHGPDDGTYDGNLVLDYSVFYDNASECKTGETGGSDETLLNYTSCSFVNDLNANNTVLTDSPVEDVSDIHAPDIRPVDTLNVDVLDPTSLGSFFSTATYIGAVSPTGTNWTTERWTSYRND